MSIVASCAPACDPSYIFSQQAPGDIHSYTIMALCSGVILLGEAAVIARILHRRGALIWRRVDVLLPAVAGVAVLVLVQRGWSTFMTLPDNPLLYFQSDTWYPRLESAWQSAITLGSLACLGTLALLIIGAMSVRATKDRAIQTLRVQQGAGR